MITIKILNIFFNLPMLLNQISNTEKSSQVIRMKTVSATPLQCNPVLQFLQCSVLRTTHHNIPALEGIVNVIVIIDFLTFLFTAVNNISALD